MGSFARFLASEGRNPPVPIGTTLTVDLNWVRSRNSRVQLGSFAHFWRAGDVSLLSSSARPSSPESNWVRSRVSTIVLARGLGSFALSVAGLCEPGQDRTGLTQGGYKRPIRVVVPSELGLFAQNPWHFVRRRRVEFSKSWAEIGFVRSKLRPIGFADDSRTPFARRVPRSPIGAARS